MSEEKPVFVPVDLTELMTAGVLMAANERFFWPFGLALAWDHDKETGIASNLHVREWQYEDGHHEGIGLGPDDPIVPERRSKFDEWASARVDTMPEAERARAGNAWASPLYPTPPADR
jgi:hypothetical protein